MHLIGKL